MKAIQSSDHPANIVRLARERLYTAVVADVLDMLGLSNQILGSNVRPVDETQVVCGRARTGDFKDIYHESEGTDSYEHVAAFVDTLNPDDVLVLACGRSGRLHPCGETLATAAYMRKVAGCVTDGLVRDVRQIRALGFPTFGAGYGALKLRGRGRLVATDVPVQCSGVWVSPGDLILGDVDGVIAVPRQVEDQVVRMSLDKADKERQLAEEIREGRSLAELYRKHRVL